MRIWSVQSILAVAALVGGTAVTAVPATAQTELLMSFYGSKRSVLFKAYGKPWAEEVQAASKGSIKVTIPAAPLAPPPRQWNAVEKGVADVSYTPISWLTHNVHLPQMVDIPGNNPGAEAAGVALHRTHVKYFDKANEYGKLKYITYFVAPPHHIHSANKPIRKIEDFAGFKVRLGPGLQSKMFQALGASPVPGAAVKTFDMISKGVVDGACFAGPTALAFRYIRYLKHTTLVPGGILTGAFVAFMNGDTWKRLSASQKKAIDSVSGEHRARLAGQILDAENIRAMKEYAKFNVQVHTADAAFIKEAFSRLAFVKEDWLKLAAKRGVDGEAAIAYYRQMGNKVADEIAKR